MNKFNVIFFIISCIFDYILAQRGFYSGARPQGYKDKYVPQIEQTINNRFDSSPVNTPDGRIPVNANNDIYLVNYLSSLPRDKQPFWFINYQQLEAQRRQPFPSATQGVSAQPTNRSPFLGSSTGNTGSQSTTTMNNRQDEAQNTRILNRFDGNVGQTNYQAPPYQGAQRYGPFKVVVGLPPSNTNSLR